MTAEDSKRLEVREIIRDTLAHHGHEGDELLEAPATHAAAAVGGPMTDIVARLRDQCCRLGHDDHGHTNCWLFGRAAAEIERLREENTTLRERTTPPHPMTFIPGHVGDPAFEPGPTDPEPSSAVDGVWVTYYSDRSAVVVFATELEALRHAVELSMQVEFRQFGVDLFRGER